MKSPSRFASLGLAVLALTLPQFASAQTIVDLGTLGGSYSYPYLINNTGMVVGNAALPTDSTTFIWSEATGMVALPAIGVGGNPANFLTDAGLVGGYYTPGTTDAYGNPATQAFLWSAATGYRFIGTLGGNYSQPQFVNSAGTVVGYSTLAGDMITRTFVWNAASGMTDIGSLGGAWTYAEAINASGQIIGESATDADGNWQPFIWDAAHGLQPIVTGLGGGQPFLLSDSGVVWGNGEASAGGQRIYSWSAASGVSTFDISPFVSPGMLGFYSIFSFRGTTPSGKAVIGAWVFMGNTYSFVIDPVTGPQVIVPPGGNADGSGVQLDAVSKAGHAVGHYQRADIGSTHAFIWDEANGARDLGTLPGGSYSYANVVNNLGEVTGSADTATGEQHAFLWTAASGMQDLGTLGGSYSYGSLIGDSGLAGSSVVAGDQESHAFFVKLRNATTGDVEVPIITSLSTNAPTLWPANHKMVAVTVTANATDNVGVTSLKITSVTSSEPDNGLGDGDTANDIQITGAMTVSLRAERSGKGNGRTYTITVEAKDAAGNTSTKTVTVSVPKNQSGK